MTTKPEPVGWWCPKIEDTVGKSTVGCLDIPHTHEPLYTRTQVRKGFEELARTIEAKNDRNYEDRCTCANEVRLHMEEW